MKTWEEIMKERSTILHEVTILYYALLGHMHSERTYDQSVGRSYSESALDHWDSKRPYGNKDIPMSIAFILGWNKEYVKNDVLCRLPQFVEDEAMKLHQLVKEEIISNNKLMSLNY